MVINVMISMMKRILIVVEIKKAQVVLYKKVNEIQVIQLIIVLILIIVIIIIMVMVIMLLMLIISRRPMIKRETMVMMR